MFGRDSTYIMCFCKRQLRMQRVNGYMKCSHCGAQHTTGPGGTKVSNPGNGLEPVNEPIPVPLFQPKFTEAEVSAFVLGLEKGLILPEDF